MNKQFTAAEIRQARSIVGSANSAKAVKTLRARYTPEQISERNRKAALARWARVSERQKSAHGKKMAAAHWAGHQKTAAE
jgi:hypothetical protein